MPSPQRRKACLNAPSGAQCFPTLRITTCSCKLACLNAPSGAQCFPTSIRQTFRRTWILRLNAPSGAQCFPTGEYWLRYGYAVKSQCTFWCSVLSDALIVGWDGPGDAVSMHLLVLSAFRLSVTDGYILPDQLVRSQCTFWCSVLSDMAIDGLDAATHIVSMHLLVLSAFRLLPQKTAPQRRLLERNRRRHGKHHIESARTRPIKPHNREKPPQTTPAPPTPPTSRYATGFQRTQAKKPTPHDYATVNTATKATVDCPCADTTDRFSLTASLGPTAASRWLPRPGCPPHPVDRRDPTVRRFHVNRRPPLAQPRCTG